MRNAERRAAFAVRLLARAAFVVRSIVEAAHPARFLAILAALSLLGSSPALANPAALPTDMTLDEVLEDAEEPPRIDFPDRMLRGFVLMDQIEYRVQDDAEDELGWEGQAWIGYDFDRLWIKSEGGAIFSGTDRGEAETDVLYSRWITPFWSAQVGVQYASRWSASRYDDLWSAAIALQGFAPGQVETEAALYVSEDGDVTLELEGEYDLRLSQRLVLQARIELLFSAQDVSDRVLGRGLATVDLDLRVRYEVRRRFAPYVGFRYARRVGETADAARGVGGDADDALGLFGLRVAW